VACEEWADAELEAASVTSPEGEEEDRLNADLSDYTGPTFPCPYGKTARYAGRHAKAFQTVLGELTLERAHYHCEVCQGGFWLLGRYRERRHA